MHIGMTRMCISISSRKGHRLHPLDRYADEAVIAILVLWLLVEAVAYYSRRKRRSDRP